MALGRLSPDDDDSAGKEEVGSSGRLALWQTNQLFELIGSRTLDYDDLIVDEFSMVPSELLADLIHKRRPKRLILIGDKNQLQPVSWGNLCRELLKSPHSRWSDSIANHRSKGRISQMIGDKFVEN